MENKYKEALDDLQDYHNFYGDDVSFENYKLLKELVERGTPKKPKIFCDDYRYFECPSCGMTIGFMNEREEHHYCLNCGQAIDWRVRENNG